MMNDAVALLTQCVNTKIHLDPDGKEWELSENKKTIRFKVPITTNQSFGFSLDNPCSFSNNYFFSNTPPKHIAKMCDAIIALDYENQTYMFLIEQKTSRTGSYKKQISNAQYFCQWLFELLKEHNYYDGDVEYIGLLYRDRQTPSKGKSRHKQPQPISVNKNGIKCYETNRDTTHLLEYLLKKPTR